MNVTLPGNWLPKGAATKLYAMAEPAATVWLDADPLASAKVKSCCGEAVTLMDTFALDAVKFESPA